MTLDGEVGGSLPYMAPEQITQFRDAQPATDLYAVGATLYNLVTGNCVYDFPSRAADRIVTILTQPIVPLAQRDKQLPQGFCQAVERALVRKPDDRFESAAAMRKALWPFC
jgi:serine/threonine-protein kinase